MLRAIAWLTVGAIVLLGLAFGSPPPSRPKPLTEPPLDPELPRTWEKFAQAVRRNDRVALRQLSASCISCTECLRNTPAEAKALDRYRKQHPDTWYDRLYGPMKFIPAETFWREDGAVVFDAKTTARLLNPAKLAFIASDHNQAGYVAPCLLLPAQVAATQLYEVLLTSIDPSPQREGLQQAFAFISTKQGYKFCGYATIP